MTKTQKHPDRDYARLVEELKNGHQDRLREVYQDHRHAFISWALARFSCQEEEAKEIFQDVMLAFYEHVMNGNIDSLNSQLRTYLFGIGRLMLLKRYRQRKRLVSHEEHFLDNRLAEEQLPGQGMEETERSMVVKRAIEALGDNCRKLLISVYYQKLSGQIIAQQLGYKNADVVKSQKSRCMKELRKLVKQQFERDEV